MATNRLFGLFLALSGAEYSMWKEVTRVAEQIQSRQIVGQRCAKCQTDLWLCMGGVSEPGQ